MLYLPYFNAEGRFLRDHMQSPKAPVYYNGGMGGTDFYDRTKKYEHASLVHALISKAWPDRLNYGCLDMINANAFIVYKEYSRSGFEHGHFQKLLITELFKRARGMPITSESCYWPHFGRIYID